MEIKKQINEIRRYPYLSCMRRRLKNKNFVLFTSNCIGGCLLHDLNLPFNTPTINLTIPKFITFVENWDYYLSIEPKVFPSEEKNYPVCSLEDVKLEGVHYKDHAELIEAWNRRKRRFYSSVDSGAEILIMAADTQLNEQNSIQRFCELPYRKIAFTARKIESSDFIHIPDFNGCDHVGDLTKYADLLGRRIFEKYFDCVSFINDDKGK